MLDCLCNFVTVICVEILDFYKNNQQSIWSYPLQQEYE